MKSIRAAALLALASLAMTACGPAAIDWRNHQSLRSAGKGQKGVTLSHVDPSEVVENAISRDLHYVTISLDSVFFRNLPGLFSGATVVFGFEVQGILPKGESIKTVFEPRKAVGENAFLAMDNVTVIQPFLYTGQNITITLYFQAVEEGESLNIAGRIQGAAGLLKKLNPMAEVAVNTAKSLFTSIIGAFRKKEMQWKYSFTLYPADSVYRDKPELLFLAGRHILVAIPPTSASEGLRKKVNLKTLTSDLRLRGNRLVWKENDEEYTTTPYIILNITRYKRYPNEDTELRKLVKQVESLYETGAFERALEQLKNVGAAINEDRVITQNEKNLERSLMDYRRAKIEAAVAKQKGDTAEFNKQADAQIKILKNIMSEFKEILEPFEVKDYQFQIRRLERTLKEAGGGTTG
jgi:hypothetical protein